MLKTLGSEEMHNQAMFTRLKLKKPEYQYGISFLV